MALRKIHNTYYVYFRDIDGTQRTRSLKTTDKATAEKLHRRFMVTLQAKKGDLMIMRTFPERFPQAAEVKTVAPPTITEQGEHQRGSIALDKMWKLALTRRNLSNTHRIRWQSFLDGIGVKYADEVTSAKALKYLEDNYSGGNGKTFNNVKSILNTIFRCCLVEAGLSESPFAPIMNRKVTEVEHHRNLSDEEIAKLMSSPNVPEYAKIMTMLSRWTAQRLETCARITPDMFDFETLVFLIDPGKNKRFKEWVCAPIFPELEKYIKPILVKCKHPDKPIVQQFKYTRNDDFSREYRKLLQALGIVDTAGGKASFHSLRGRAITWLKEIGIDREARRSITGHDSQDVEDIYAKDTATISKIAHRLRDVV